jgi:hypothetical protein
MSALLDSLLPAEKLADIARNESAMECGPLRLFLVTIGARNAPRLEFQAMARSGFDCTMQHAGLAQLCERVEVREVKRG